MGNISINLNLSQLKHVKREMKGKDGKNVTVLIIPIEENNIIQGEKGNYINITAIEIKDRSKQKEGQKDTHLLKQDFPKEIYNSMSEEERRAQPILGNAILWGQREAEPQQSTSLSESAVDQYNEAHDDLPF